jgi:hypothetical protein
MERSLQDLHEKEDENSSWGLKVGEILQTLDSGRYDKE